MSYDGVTNAALSAQVAALTHEFRTWAARMDRRMDFFEEKMDIDLGSLRSHCTKNEQDIAVLSERVNTRTGIFGVVQAVGLTAATILGIKL